VALGRTPSNLAAPVTSRPCRPPGLQTAAAALAVVVVLLVAAALTQPAAAGALRSPTPGLQDDQIYDTRVDAEARVADMARLGASVIRVDLRWDLVASRRPRAPRDPRDPAYDWRRYDRIVAAARRRGVAVLFTVWGTPEWARDPAVPASARFPGRATRPRDPADFGRFGAAAARRYAPGGVRRWEAWNEPNLPLFLRPQYQRRGGRYRPVSPAVYRRMLNAFYREVKRVDARARIGGGVTAPIGDRCPFSCPDGPDDRVPPLRFWRGLTTGSPAPLLDRVAHHPYPVTPPRNRTSPRAAYVDLYNLSRLTGLVDRTPLRGTPLWLTEFGFGTRSVPEYPLAVSERQQAAFLVDAYRRTTRDGRVRLLVWFNLRDHPQWSSGLQRSDGRPKPAARAHRLPATPARTGAVATGSRVTVRGQARRARRGSLVLVQRQNGRGWVTTARARTTSDGSFRATVRARRTARYRARWSGVVRGGGRSAAISRSFVVRVRA